MSVAFRVVQRSTPPCNSPETMTPAATYVDGSLKAALGSERAHHWVGTPLATVCK